MLYVRVTVSLISLYRRSICFLIARSPLTGHVNSTLEGLTTIRASNAQKIVIQEFDRHQDLFTSALLMVITNFVTVSVFLKYLSTVFTSLIIFQFLLTDAGKFDNNHQLSKKY